MAESGRKGAKKVVSGAQRQQSGREGRRSSPKACLLGEAE